MKNQDKLCQKLQETLVMHGKQSLSPRLSQHLHSCRECQEFLQGEELLHAFKTELKTRPLKLDSEYDFEVRNTIVATALRLQNTKPSYAWWKKPALVMVSFMLLCALFWGSWPMLSNLPLWDYQVQLHIAQLLNEETMSVASPEADRAVSMRAVDTENNSYQILQFASWALPGAESQKAFWTSDKELSQRFYWIWIRFLSEKSQQPYLKVKQILDTYGDTKALRMLKLPLRKTVSEFEEYLKPFRLGPKDEAFEADVLVLAVNLAQSWIRVDMVDEPLHLDPVLLNQMYPGKMLRITIKKENSLYYAVAISETLLSSSLIEGKISSINKQQIVTSSFSDPLEVNEKTFYRNITPTDLSANTEDVYWLRVLFSDKKPYILSLTRRGLPFQQTLSGTIERLSSYGFTLKDYPLHFFFTTPPDIFPSNYSLSEIANRKFWITVDGIQYDDQVFLTKIQVLENPLDPFPNEDYLLASASSEKTLSSPLAKSLIEDRQSFSSPSTIASSPKEPNKMHSDYIVGTTGHILHLASGKDISYTLSFLSPGSQIQWQGSVSEITSTPDVALGRWSMVQSSYRLINRYDNGVLALRLKDYSKPLYIYTAEDIPDEGMLQARVVIHDQLMIAVESRSFTLSHVLSVRGTVVQIMNKESSFLLDNGTMFVIDELSQIIHGPIWHGSTVVVKGAMIDQVFKAFIVEVESEELIFTGLIVSIDLDKGLIHLDSGASIFINDKTVFSYPRNSLAVGSAVLIRARREASRYIAVEILDAKDHVSDKGANT
jgi:hypothetical protein